MIEPAIATISASRSPSALPNCGARTSPAARSVNSAIGGEGDEMAAVVFIALEDLRLVDFLAGGGVMRPKRDACRALGLIRVFAGAIAQGRARSSSCFSRT